MATPSDPLQAHRELLDFARRDPQGFWKEAAEAIDWTSAPTRIFDPDAGVYGRWYADGICNTCHNCLDRHVEAGCGDRPALIYDSPMTGVVERLSYRELRDRTATLAAVMIERGVTKGDRILIYMPMIPQTVVAMLACARIGAVHSVVFGGFAAPELAKRIDDCRPKLILTASCGLEPGRLVAYMPLVDEALKIARHAVAACIVHQRPEEKAVLREGRDLDWETLIQAAEREGRQAPCIPLKATDPLYLLYTSGTTGRPKGVIRDHGGHMAALAWSMPNIYGVGPGETFWAASDVGWVVGHSYIVYAPLLNGSTSILYEGKPVGTPDAGAFWRVISDHGVKVLFTAPTAFRAVKREDPHGALIETYDLGSLKTLFLAGERADPETLRWAERHLNVPAIDHWWQTETGWAIAANPVGRGMLPIKTGSSGVCMPGYEIDILDENGRPSAPDDIGAVAIRLPLPPGCLPSLWNDDERFRQGYLSKFPGYYETADAGYRDKDGCIFIMSRTDDIINVAGHRLSTGAMEEVVAMHPDIAECAVIGVADPLKGHVPLALFILNAGVERETDAIADEIIALVRNRIGPVAALKRAVAVARLPKTRSGKVLRASLRDIADGKPYETPATIDDPAILDDIARTLGAG